MIASPDVAQCNTCDEKLVNVEPRSFSDRQRRFLDAYRRGSSVTAAGRLAAVHRATVYRWLEDEAFATAMRAASDACYRENRARVLAEEAARALWRQERERERRPMRCFYLARA